jgi:esterase
MNPLLNYKTFGDPENKSAIILLHGLLGSMENWRSQAQKLSDHYFVITPDLRNHGQSPHLSGMRYKDMAGDILALAEHLGLEQFDLLGHSMGGKVAMYLALHHPETVNKLIIVDIAPKSYPLWHLTVFRALLGLPIDEITSRKQANDLLAEAIESPAERAFLLKNMQTSDAGGYEWRCNLPEITRTYLNIANFNPTADAVFDKPCIFIKGALSHYIDVDADYDCILPLFPQARIHTQDGAGHLPHVETPAPFFEMISEFLSVAAE